MIFVKKYKQSFQLNFKQIDWKFLLLLCVACCYLAIIGNETLKGNKSQQYRGDYLAFWSVGKIANEKGFSEIYDLDNLQSTQSQGLKSLGFVEGIDGLANPIIPVPYFSFFVLPFQLLSRVSLILGYWLWTICNFVILLGYLVFFLRKICLGSITGISTLKILVILLIAYPVFLNFWIAQVEVFLVVCVGEFIRAAVCKKPIVSGLWLGGLTLKPQLLIIVIPIFLITRNWKVLRGFLVSSGVILSISLFLSRLAGMKALINLWTNYSINLVATFPESMINWRMVGINLNTFTGTSFGWAITGLGMVLTILAVYIPLKPNPEFGSTRWVMSMLGIFSATLAVTWHSHYHMAIVLIPFLIYLSLHQLLSQNMLFLWSIATPVLLFGVGVVNVFFQVVTRCNSMDYDVLIVTAFSGFILNIVVFISSLRSSITQELQHL